MLKKVLDGLGLVSGPRIQPSTSALKAVKVPAENAWGESLSHSLMAKEKEKKKQWRWMSVLY